MLNHNLIQSKHNLRVKQMYNVDFIYQEVAKRMQDRLDYIKLIPTNLLDIGSGMQIDANLLKQRYSKANIYQLDSALAVLKNNQPQVGMVKKFFSKSQNLICADATQIPLASQSVDVVWSNLTLPYVDNMEEYFKEIRRVLTLGGYFLVTGFGVDSLQQLRDVGLTTYDFPDMHIIGDILVKLGFTNPVTDLEYITIEYDNCSQLLNDIRILGCGAATARKSNLTRNEYKDLQAKFAKLTQNGKIPLTLEIFYAHGWKDNVRLDLPPDQKVVQFHPQQKVK